LENCSKLSHPVCGAELLGWLEVSDPKVETSRPATYLPIDYNFKGMMVFPLI
jgi:hypothetical protein